jgi:ATP-dependent Clp protease ATP-binding subunit ClpC
VFQRFTDAARHVVVAASTEAAALNHHYIGTEHILLGMGSDEAGAAFRLLQLFDIPRQWTHRRVEEIVGRGTGDAPKAGHIPITIPFTPRAKKVLEQSLREAIRLGDRFIGSEHLLLGLLREGGGVAAQLLAERGVTLPGVEARLGDVEREPPPDPGLGDDGGAPVA